MNRVTERSLLPESPVDLHKLRQLQFALCWAVWKRWKLPFFMAHSQCCQYIADFSFSTFLVLSSFIFIRSAGVMQAVSSALFAVFALIAYQSMLENWNLYTTHYNYIGEYHGCMMYADNILLFTRTWLRYVRVFAIKIRLSVVCLSVTLVHSIESSAIFLHRCVPWPSSGLEDGCSE